MSTETTTETTTKKTGPIRVALVNDSTIVIKGLAAMLAAHTDRIEVVELDSLRDPVEDVHVVLKDTFGMIDDLRDFIGASQAPVVIFAFAPERAAVQAALGAGAAGYVAKTVSEDRLVSALERVAGGEQVVEVDHVDEDDVEPDDAAEPEQGSSTDWPGRAEGLTQRESEILTLICRGLSNQDVAGTLYLSINSVKTYIRSTYRKIGAESRSQAVIWGLDHDFAPRAWRHRPGRDD